MKKLIIIAAAALLVLGGVIGTVVAINNSPKMVAMHAITNAVEDLGKRDEIAPVVNAMNGGSLSFSAKGTDLEELMGLDDKMEISGKLYMNAEKQTMMLDKLSFEMGDVALSGQIYMGTDAIYVSNEEILDGTYGLERGSLAKSLKRSLLAPNSGSDYAMEEDDYEVLLNIFEALDDEVDQEIMKDLEKITERYSKKLWKLVGEYAEFESETDDVRINGERKKARVITITLDDKAVCRIAEDMIEYVLDDDELEDLVKKYGDRFEDILKNQLGIDDLSDKYDDLMDELDDNKDEILDSIKDVVSDDLVVTMVTPVATADLLMFAVEYDDTQLVQVDIGHAGILETDCISISAAGSEISYKILKDTKKAFEAKVSVNKTDVVTFELDRSRNQFELGLADTITLEGEMSTKGKTTSITVDTLKMADGERYTHFEVNLVLNESDKMPSRAKKIVSVLSVDEKDVEEWEDKLEEMIYDPIPVETTTPSDDFEPGQKLIYGSYQYVDDSNTIYNLAFKEGTSYVDVTVIESGEYYGKNYYCRYELELDSYGDYVMTITDVYDESCPLEGSWAFYEGYDYIKLDNYRFYSAGY